MPFISSKSSDQYAWTKHSQYKMRYYGLSPQKVKRIIRHPARIEEAIVPGMIAVMTPSDSKKYSEIWAMYSLTKSKVKGQMSKIKVITAWRYPGKSPQRNPIPQEILNEIKSIL
jgi:hypothetical protein